MRQTTTLPNEAPVGMPDSDTVSWTCNVKLDQLILRILRPVQLTLVQNVNGQNVETVIWTDRRLHSLIHRQLPVQMGWIP